MIGKEIKNLVMAGALVIPLHQEGSWTQLEFNKIPANEVQFSKEQLIVKVKKSASPLIYRLNEVKMISSLKWEVEVRGVPPNSGEQFPEDFPLRVGLVAQGETTMNRFQRLVAADWVKKLFDLSPKGQGLDKIYFYNLDSSSRWVGQARMHPQSELMKETVVGSMDKGFSKLEFKLPEKLPVAALWISIDGDNTQAQYDLVIKELSLGTD